MVLAMVSKPGIVQIRHMNGHGTGRNGVGEVEKGLCYDVVTGNGYNTICDWTRNAAEWCHGG